MSSEGSTKAILAALGANIGIAITKFFAAAVSGSASMFAEGIHSVADSGNQVLLIIGGKRAKRQATSTHPFGYGRSRYIYAFMVSIVLFSVGGLFSILEGWEKLNHPHELEQAWLPLTVLGVAIGLESFSLYTALKAAKEEEAKRKAQEKLEAKEAEARHQAAVKRLQSMAGSTGSSVDTGVAPKASGPSASYIGRLRAKVKPNITFPDNLLQNMVGNPTAEVEVTCSPSGKIEDVNLLKSSGNKAWDDAVVNGLYKTAMLPRDVDGSVPTRLVFSFRPRD